MEPHETYWGSVAVLLALQCAGLVQWRRRRYRRTATADAEWLRGIGIEPEGDAGPAPAWWRFLLADPALS